MNDAERFGQYCRLTCLGGSERGSCPCTHPDDCELRGHPKFEAERKAATKRMVRVTKADEVMARYNRLP